MTGTAKVGQPRTHPLPKAEVHGCPTEPKTPESTRMHNSHCSTCYHAPHHRTDTKLHVPGVLGPIPEGGIIPGVVEPRGNRPWSERAGESRYPQELFNILDNLQVHPPKPACCGPIVLVTQYLPHYNQAGPCFCCTMPYACLIMHARCQALPLPSRPHLSVPCHAPSRAPCPPLSSRMGLRCAPRAI